MSRAAATGATAVDATCLQKGKALLHQPPMRIGDEVRTGCNHHNPDPAIRLRNKAIWRRWLPLIVLGYKPKMELMQQVAAEFDMTFTALQNVILNKTDLKGYWK